MEAVRIAEEDLIFTTDFCLSHYDHFVISRIISCIFRIFILSVGTCDAFVLNLCCCFCKHDII